MKIALLAAVIVAATLTSAWFIGGALAGQMQASSISLGLSK